MISTKALILNKEGKLLVLRNIPHEDEWGGKWCLPGGLVEMDESIEFAIKREVKEETGLEVVVKKIVLVGESRYDGWKLKDGRIVNVRQIQLCFKCKCRKGQVKLSEEHDKYSWVSKKELVKLTSAPGCVDVFRDYLR